MIETARRNRNKKKGVLQSVPRSIGRSLSDVTSASRESPHHLIRCDQKHRTVFLKIPSQAQNCEASNCKWVCLDCSANLLEALWTLRKVVLRTDLTNQTIYRLKKKSSEFVLVFNSTPIDRTPGTPSLRALFKKAETYLCHQEHPCRHPTLVGRCQHQPSSPAILQHDVAFVPKSSWLLCRVSANQMGV